MTALLRVGHAALLPTHPSSRYSSKEQRRFRLYSHAINRADVTRYYLMERGVTWEQIYAADPVGAIPDSRPEEQARVLGGEVCKWGERTDGSNFDALVWPRLGQVDGGHGGRVRLPHLSTGHD